MLRPPAWAVLIKCQPMIAARALQGVAAALLWTLYAAAALAWVTPASRARWLALAAHVRGLADPQLHQLLRALPHAVFDQLLDAAYASEGTAA